MASNPSNDDDPVVRKVQFTGGSTFTVSLPKEWARDQDLSAGARLFLYSLDDRVVVAPETPSETTRRSTIRADDFDPEAISRHVRAAYVDGADAIAIEATDSLSDRARRAARASVSALVGLRIASENDSTLVARCMLDASEVSLEQTVVQLRRGVLAAHRDGVDAVVEDDEGLAAAAADRADDATRLVALVARQFNAALVDVGEVERLDVDRSTAFRQYRVARRLEQAADAAAGIAAVARDQSSPPPAAVADRLVAAAEATRDLLETATAEEAEGPFPSEGRIERPVCDLEGSIEEVSGADTVRYGRLVELLRDTHTATLDIAATEPSGGAVTCEH